MSPLHLKYPNRPTLSFNAFYSTQFEDNLRSYQLCLKCSGFKFNEILILHRFVLIAHLGILSHHDHHRHHHSAHQIFICQTQLKQNKYRDGNAWYLSQMSQRLNLVFKLALKIRSAVNKRFQHHHRHLVHRQFHSFATLSFWENVGL